MITLFCAFFLFMLLFAVVGALRGPAKEVLVSFSVWLPLHLLSWWRICCRLTVNLFQDAR